MKYDKEGKISPIRAKFIEVYNIFVQEYEITIKVHTIGIWILIRIETRFDTTFEVFKNRI